MKSEIRKQLLGFSTPCIEYNEFNQKEHYDLLRDADEFAAAASLYPDERSELLAHSLHRYQQIINKAVEVLEIETSYLLKKRIAFNFYTDIANLFGLGTQAYTTESETPYIGVSELSLQDIYLLQLVILHEMQHAFDFVFNDGLNMGIAERELRARLSICNSLNDIHKQFNKLYKNAYIDQAYWYVILYKSSSIDLKLKEAYYDLLERSAKNILSDDDGLMFSPLIIRVFGKELERENVELKSNISYRVTKNNGKLKIEETERELSLEDDELNEMEDIITSDTETAQGEEPLSVRLSKLTGENIPVGRGNKVSLVKNKLVEWHTYKKEFRNLKKNASVVITRNAESFSNITIPNYSSVIIKKDTKKDETSEVAQKTDDKPSQPKINKNLYRSAEDNELVQLRNLEVPNSSIDAGIGEEVLLPNRPTYTKKKQVEEYEDPEDIAKNVMSNLFQFVNKQT